VTDALVKNEPTSDLTSFRIELRVTDVFGVFPLCPEIDEIDGVYGRAEVLA
jgi:hypothetical protein